jgi:hypothetical protein
MRDFHFVIYNKTKGKYLRECIEYVGIPGECQGVTLYKYSWTSLRMSRKYDTRGVREGDIDYTYLYGTLRRVKQIYCDDEIIISV